MATVIKPKRSFTTGSIPSVSDLEIGELAMNVSDGKFYTKALTQIRLKKLVVRLPSIFNQYYKQEILQLLI